MSTPMSRAEFIAALDVATEIVKTWPEWKRVVCEEALINSPWRRGSPQREPVKTPNKTSPEGWHYE